MPREVVTIPVGQAGCQIGRSYFSQVLQEHVSHSPNFTEPMSSLFRNVNSRGEDLPLGNGTNPLRSLRARTVLIDTEEGVLNETLASPLGELFEETELIKGVSGAGNNFAHGHHGYGPLYSDKIENHVRRVVEKCDATQAFFLLHSLGGGTGSGLGTYVLSLLEDTFPEICRLTVSVFPSSDDDVVTSPYNAAMAFHQLRQHADCVLPVENQALIDICNKVSQMRSTGPLGSTPSERDVERGKPFDEMNNITALMMSNLTSCSRFSGQLNVDLSELTTNMVPFPRMHFLLPSLSPLYGSGSATISSQMKPLRSMFSQAFHRDFQLTKSDPATGRHLSCAVLVRGNIELSDVNSNIARLMPTINMVPWNVEGFKIGLCSVPPPNLHRSLLCLTNNCCVKDRFAEMGESFDTLFKRRKAYVHHYTEYMPIEEFDVARSALQDAHDEYLQLESCVYNQGSRLRPALAGT